MNDAMNPNGKLTPHVARRIRKLYGDGRTVSAPELAQRFGVTEQTIRYAIRDIHGRGNKRPPQLKRGIKPALTQEQANEVRRLASRGVQGKDIALRFGISRPLVSRIIHGHVYKDPTPPDEENDDGV